MIKTHVQPECRSKHLEGLKSCITDHVSLDIHPTGAADLLDNFEGSVIVTHLVLVGGG